VVARQQVLTVCDRCLDQSGDDVAAELVTVAGFKFELCPDCRRVADEFDALLRKYAVRSRRNVSVQTTRKPKPTRPAKPVVWVRRAECLEPGCGAVVHWRSKGLHASNMHGKKAADVQWRDFQSAEGPE
jgi:hypothetical protein